VPFLLINYLHTLFHNKYINFTKIECIKENKLLGTAGALYTLKKKIKNNFILVNGDTYFDIDYTKIKFKKKSSLIKIVLTKKLDNKNLKLNSISIKNNLIFLKKNSDFMNGGIYLIKKKFLKSIKNTKSSLETDFVPDLIRMKLVEGEYFKDFFYDIGTPKNFIRASSIFKSNLTKPAVFFDRDGVINHDKRGYTYKIKDFRLRKNVYKAINFLNMKDYHIFIITNQSGIARGFYNINDFFKYKHVDSIFSKKNKYKDQFVEFYPIDTIFGFCISNFISTYLNFEAVPHFENFIFV
jgi:NDP-sugar pyrophosphorylase family protein